MPQGAAPSPSVSPCHTHPHRPALCHLCVVTVLTLTSPDLTTDLHPVWNVCPTARGPCESRDAGVTAVSPAERQARSRCTVDKVT